MPGPFDFHGLNLYSPLNRIVQRVSMAVNVRGSVGGGVTFRNLLTNAILTLGAAVHTIKRLNDSTPNGPPSGYIYISGAAATLYAGATPIATGFSGNPLSIVPFRPNASVQPVGYIGDSAPQGQVKLTTKYLSTGAATTFVTNALCKVRSDGVVWKSGVKEPQLAPVVSTTNTGVTVTGTLSAQAIPWTNVSSANTTFNYGQSKPVTPPIDSFHDGVAPYLVNVQNTNTITINSLIPVGTVTINSTPITTQNGLVAAAGRVGSGAPGYPGQFLQNSGASTHPSAASYVVGAFIDASGNVITTAEYGWVAPLYIPIVVDVGVACGITGSTPTPITVPYNAVSFQIGVNSVGNTFSSNSGSITISTTVTTNALPTVTSILGTLTAYYWGDSPTSGPVSAYIWKNPDDPGGSGPTRSTSDAVGSTTGNSFIFDATFTAGIPALPGLGSPTIPMEWTQLNPQSVSTGTNAVYQPAIKGVDGNTAYQNFNFCLTGSIYFPSSGQYTFVLTSHDDCIWGIGGGVTLVSATAINQGGSVPTAISGVGQTLTVVGGYPLLPRGNDTGSSGGSYVATTVIVNVPAAGIYPIEVDFDYWYHSGRILLLMASATAGGPATIIAPLPANVRQEVQYRYVYRSTATGAQSNPSPESTAESVPVTANTITSVWSNDPQVDVVDYYRIDSVTANFTYVGTGPNDNANNPFTTPGNNTPITDSLTDTQLSNQLLNYDNFEPFPSIDLPQKGICNVSGGVITWVSGGAIGGSAVGFNPRWLAGTTILIGSPTSLAYVFISRPYPAEFQAGYTYPTGFIILDPANHYQLVTVGGVAGGTTPTFNDTGGTTTSGGVTFQDYGFFVPTGYVTQIIIPGVPDGTNLAYQIAEPILANQPLPYIWGPTDNVNYAFGVGDPLRPGTLYWSAGSNLDASPDTNQQDVTDPGEPLVNGAIAVGLGVLFSIKRGWLIMPNFSSAVATATGTTGSTWTLQESSITRGLYMPWCVTVAGGGLIFFRVNDGVHVSSYGSASQSITDEDLYPLFPHESSDSGTSVPQVVVRNGISIFPPDDSQPSKQRFRTVGNYFYYDYVGLGDGLPHTLTYSIKNQGWIWDLYNPPATCHASNEGQSIQGVLVGGSDGTIRQMVSSGGTETITGTVATPAFGGKGYMHCGMAVVEYSSTSTVTLSFYVADEGNNSYAPQPVTLPATGGQLTKYFFKPSAAKWKLLVAQFSSTVPFILNFQGTCLYLRAWGSSGEYQPTPIFGSVGGEG